MSTSFVMRDKIYQTDAWKAVFNAGSNRYGYGYIREAIFARLLVLCAQNVKFVNAAQFAQISMSPIKVCEVVWAVCVEKNVLRQQDGYYSALEWMIENGFVGDTNKPIAQPQPKPQPTSQSIRHTECNDGKSVGEALRHNVSMNRDQVQDILKYLTPEEFAYGLDLLSEWKTNKGDVTCNNDYYHFKKWVIKAVKKEFEERKKNEEKSDDYYNEFFKELYPENNENDNRGRSKGA